MLETTRYSKSILYEWSKDIQERQPRAVKCIDEAVAVNAIKLIIEYPHLGGEKGQAYMTYHRLGYIPRHVYQSLKKVVGRVFFQEVTAKNLLPKSSDYEHVRPTKVNEIWAEDFTTLKILGFIFSLAVLEDVFSKKYLGNSTQERASYKLVAEPVEMAVAENNQQGPEKFMLADHGPQYVSDAHGNLLFSYEIIQKLIPVAKPQYNGTIESGMRDLKSVFYNVMSSMDLKEFAQPDLSQPAKKKKLLESVALAGNTSVRIMNAVIPRPVLGGVTAEDVATGKAEEKRQLNAEYLKQEQMKEKSDIWSKSKYDLAKEALRQKKLSNTALLIKHYFFQKRPLRKISKLPPEVWTN